MRYDQKQRRRKLQKKHGKQCAGVFKDKVVRGVILGIPFTSQFGGLNLFGTRKGFKIGHHKGEP